MTGSIGVVIATRHRPRLLNTALASVLDQHYAGALRVVIVYDGTEPDESLRRTGRRPVDVVVNTRTAGLAGARNTGILALSGPADPVDLVAFCDDDDRWLPGKLTAQVAALAAHPGAEFCTAAIEVEFGSRVNPRLAGTGVVILDDLLRSRMAMLHSSTFLIRRTALVPDPRRDTAWTTGTRIGTGAGVGPVAGPATRPGAARGADRVIGLVAEDAPGSQNEDYDLLLRAARRRPITHVDRPLVRVLWGRTSYFAHQYQTKIESLEWLLARHPALADCRPGAARLYGQLACWHAAVGSRRHAVNWARRSLRHRWREPRAAIALAAAARLISVETVLSALHRRGRGL